MVTVFTKQEVQVQELIVFQQHTDLVLYWEAIYLFLELFFIPVTPAGTLSAHLLGLRLGVLNTIKTLKECLNW